LSLKLFYITTEITPFANTYSLADFSAKVPLALQTMGHDVRTMLPKYGFVSQRKYILREVIRLREIPFTFDGKDQMASAKSAFIPKTRVQVYFLEHDHWFKPLTNLLYKSKNGRVLADNSDRYSFYANASIATLPHLFWKPDILLCNDWQSSVIPAVYKQLYADQDFYKDIKTVVLIHSLDEYSKFEVDAYKKSGLDLEKILGKKKKINGFEIAVEFADAVVVLDDAKKKLSQKIMKLESFKKAKKKLTLIQGADTENPDHHQLAASLNETLQKLSS
jgi:starch synthase